MKYVTGQVLGVAPHGPVMLAQTQEGCAVFANVITTLSRGRTAGLAGAFVTEGAHPW